MKITAVIITLNEADCIGRCLHSVAGVADDIIVMDSGSTDRTCELASGLGATVVYQPWQGYSAQKNLANSLVNEGYILSLDADEWLSDPLRDELLRLKPALDGNKAISFPRLNNYCGRWIRHGGYYPDLKIRLFPAQKARWTGAYVHETLQVDAGISIVKASGDLLHFSYVSISDHINRADYYSSLAAERLQGKSRTGLLLRMLFSPATRFYRNYLLRLGFLDGYEGFLLSAITSVEVFLKYAKALMPGRSTRG